ncbi:hypothetical protein [Sutcliffiella rhizosphaerae]|uniref:Uncharacterized protein n=1 Tax=Sutcliffiella rhizosphaerae TaxID=2880967 RepID=A0ABN8A8R0_9BACI|nr:hypothetical protein [Sutcliffiella rhizosphaerae]CAG9621541.1 hypothetical protein BACCIP111883_02314 [Sutcliffiella rhizosphaerae]
MKRAGVIFGIILIVMIIVSFVNKLYYPPLPINGITGKEAIAKLQNSNSGMVEIATEGDYVWYITSTENQGVYKEDLLTKKLMVSYGWEFEEKLGSGLIFVQDGETMVVTTEMWTGKYVLIKIPSNYRDN